MHRWLIRLLSVINVRLVYGFANLFIVPVTMMVIPRGARVIYRYLRQRHGFGRWKSLRLTYRNHCFFAQVVIDRFAMYAGKKFEIVLDGAEQWLELSDRPEGFIQLSSHIGNYELAGYSLRTVDKRCNALIFADEKEIVMNGRTKLFESNNIRMIPMMADMSHLFTIDRALADGEIISMPADRVFGSQKTFTIPFLGADARFPQGSFTLGALRNVAMIFVAVMKTAPRRYTIHIRRLDPQVEGNTRRRAEILARNYVGFLEEIVRRYPTQWYNYFDFWTK